MRRCVERHDQIAGGATGQLNDGLRLLPPQFDARWARRRRTLAADLLDKDLDSAIHERLMNFAPREVVDPRSRRRTMAPDEDYNHLRTAGIAKALVDAGGRAHLGAHGQLAGLAAHWELWMFQQGGMTPHECLRAATLDGAFHLGLDGDLGSIEAGKLADLVVMEKNPLENLRDSEHIRYTILGGRVLDARTMQEIDPGTGERGPRPTYFWQDLEGSIGAAPASTVCACGG